ncbi:hypothetical protein BN133_2711 [Cronobacter dublinensis 582]|nr:hypothetical protein BN133_2711 [Cronobacter dublinensis 582]
MKNRLRAEVVFFKRGAVQDARQQGVHIAIDFKTLRQGIARGVLQTRAQRLHQRFDRSGVRKVQHRLLLARRVADKRRQRRHRAVAVGQHFFTDNRVNGGRLTRLHRADNRQHHLLMGGFSKLGLQHLLLGLHTTQRKMKRMHGCASVDRPFPRSSCTASGTFFMALRLRSAS